MKFFLLLIFPLVVLAEPPPAAPPLEKNFSKLPLEARVKTSDRYWSGDYWPLNKGNINYRWHAPKPTGFSLYSPTQSEARAMTLAQLSALSPAEKFDLLNGRYTYPLKREVEKIIDRYADPWEGICRGWAAASMNHREPFAKGIKNSDGIVVPFGSSDIKALLSFYYARVALNDQNQSPGGATLNADAFHLVLANKMGLLGEGFIMDIKNGKQAWNWPLVTYKSRVLKTGKPAPTSPAGTVKRIKIETTVRVIVSTANTWEPVIGTPAQKEAVKKYVYQLDLNAQEEIIGGEWISLVWPISLWVKFRPRKFPGPWAKLELLLNE